MYLAEDLVSYLEHLHRLNFMSKGYNHGIEMNNQKWELFEPTKFIYSYFTFNIIYNIDWENSFEKSRILYFKDSLSHNSNFTEPKKVRFHLKFLKRIENEDKLKLFYNNLNELSYIDEEGLNKIDLKEYVKDAFFNMKSGGSIDKEMIRNYNTYLLQFQYGDLGYENLNKMTYFIQMVRNNIFHGQKNIIQMSERQQQIRLLFYTAFINSLNDCLFNLISNKYDFHFPTKYKLS